mmetsp:Transcript_27466/g.45067  ORF Transcript_27466/g.45067 Transcript_27466/m.45067 type:complete len:540 (-) Transcript_27466:545-2164(-)
MAAVVIVGGYSIAMSRAAVGSGAATARQRITAATRQQNNTAIARRRQRCHSCAPPQSHPFGSHNNNGIMLRYCPATRSGRSNFDFRPRLPSATRQKQQQQQQRIQFSTKSQHHPPSSANNTSKNQTIRTILSSSSFQNATPTAHPLLRHLTQSLQQTLLKPRSLPLPRYISPQHYSFTLSECFGHSSFIFVAASYLTQDFLELRIMAVLGSTSMLFFTYFHPHGRVLWLPLKWNVLFIAINSYRIGKVLYDRYMAGLVSDELKGFREEHLNVVDIVDYYKLMRIAKEEVYEEGDLVLGQGYPNPNIRIVLEGELQVLRDGTLTYVLEKGNFVSESGLHAGLLLRGGIESCGSIVVGRPFDPTGSQNGNKKQPNDTQINNIRKKNRVRCLRWDRGELVELLEDDKALRNALQAALSWDIVRKLKMQRHMLTAGRVKDPAAWTQKREDQGISRYASILQNMLQHTEECQDMSEMLTKYRMIHHIDDRDHERALAECGWTEEEFRLGKKRQVVEDEEEEELESAQWRRVKRYSSKVVRSLLQ